jgi:hypothetical protein
MYIGFTGAHGTGKSTAMFEEVLFQKKLNPNLRVGVMTDVVRSSPLPVGDKATPESQMWIFCKHMEAELELMNRYDILVSDRTVVDAIGYSLALGFRDIVPGMVALAKHHTTKYDKITFKTIACNNYNFDDGVRPQDAKFHKLVEESIMSAYILVGIHTRLIPG